MSRIPKAAKGLPVDQGARRFSAFGNLVLDGDLQDEGYDPQIASCSEPEVAQVVADILEVSDRATRGRSTSSLFWSRVEL